MGTARSGEQLPSLSKETAAQWATDTKEVFLIAYRGNFEEHAGFIQRAGHTTSWSRASQDNQVRGHSLAKVHIITSCYRE